VSPKRIDKLCHKDMQNSWRELLIFYRALESGGFFFFVSELAHVLRQGWRQVYFDAYCKWGRESPHSRDVVQTLGDVTDWHAQGFVDSSVVNWRPKGEGGRGHFMLGATRSRICLLIVCYKGLQARNPFLGNPFLDLDSFFFCFFSPLMVNWDGLVKGKGSVRHIVCRLNVKKNKLKPNVPSRRKPSDKRCVDHSGMYGRLNGLRPWTWSEWWWWIWCSFLRKQREDPE
jgi:hypothetical protein